jgi:hypothetical protein
MFLTHFGRVDDVPRLAADLRRGIDRLAEIAQRNQDAPDLELNTQGLEVWLDREARDVT